MSHTGLNTHEFHLHPHCHITGAGCRTDRICDHLCNLPKHQVALKQAAFRCLKAVVETHIALDFKSINNFTIA